MSTSWTSTSDYCLVTPSVTFTAHLIYKDYVLSVFYRYIVVGVVSNNKNRNISKMKSNDENFRIDNSL